MKLYEYKFSGGRLLENEIEVEDNGICWTIKEPGKSLFSIRVLSKKSEGHLFGPSKRQVYFTQRNMKKAKELIMGHLENRVERLKRDLERSENLLASLKNEEQGLPRAYAEVEYDDFDDPEAIEGARFDDMNFLRYMER